jgi:hypothetical protein
MALHYYTIAMSVGLSIVIYLPPTSDALLIIGYYTHSSFYPLFEMKHRKELGKLG